jgi:hypothetical protein
MYPHRIRLRGPWQLEPLAWLVRTAGAPDVWQKTGLPPPRTAIMPATWKDCGLADFAGIVRHRRSFGLPRKLDDYETIWITFTGLADTAEWWLNQDQIRSLLPHNSEVNVTGMLRERNELWLDVTCDCNGAGTCGEVALEIRALAWLKNVQAKLLDGRIELTGRVEGRSDSPLDLYAILDRHTVIQASIAPSETGTTFRFLSPELTLEGLEHLVRVELVSGANVWYSVEQSVTMPL